jgi:protein TonB
MPSAATSKANLEKARERLQAMIAAGRESKSDDGVYNPTSEEPEQKPKGTKPKPKPKPKPKAQVKKAESESEDSDDSSSSSEEDDEPATKKPRTTAPEKPDAKAGAVVSNKRKPTSKAEERKKAMQEDLSKMIREELGKFQKQTHQTLKHQLATHSADLALSRVHIVT